MKEILRHSLSFIRFSAKESEAFLVNLIPAKTAQTIFLKLGMYPVLGTGYLLVGSLTP